VLEGLESSVWLDNEGLPVDERHNYDSTPVLGGCQIEMTCRVLNSLTTEDTQGTARGTKTFSVEVQLEKGVVSGLRFSDAADLR